eukprot:ANDGO_07300.mRNA.1 Kinesin light chain
MGKSTILQLSNALSVNGFNRKSVDRSMEASACFGKFSLHGVGSHDDFRTVISDCASCTTTNTPQLYCLELQISKQKSVPPVYAYCTDVSACCCVVLLSWTWNSCAKGRVSFLELSIRTRLPLMYAHEKMENLMQTLCRHSDGQSLMEVLDCIGVGGCGAVYRVLLGSQKKMFACKVSCHPDVQHVEETTWSALDGHSHIAPIVFAHDGAVFTEYFDHGSLKDYISSTDWSTRWMSSPREMLLVCRHVASQIASAVGYMHSLEYMHLDLKPENVLVSHELWIHENIEKGIVEICDSKCVDAIRSMHVCLCDFGLAQVEKTAKPVLGTPGWNSPEQQRYEKSTTASDVFSLGLVLSWLLHPQNARLDDDSSSSFEKWQDSFRCSGISENLLEFVDCVWLRVMERILSRDFPRRPTAFHVANAIRTSCRPHLAIYTSPSDARRLASSREHTLLIFEEMFGNNTPDYFEHCCHLVSGLRRGNHSACVVRLFPLECVSSLLKEGLGTNLVCKVASCLSDLGQLKPVVPLLSGVLERSLTGTNQNVTVDSIRNNLGLCLLHQGKCEDALSMFQSVLKMNIESFGEEDLKTLEVRANIAQCFHFIGKHSEAIEQFKYVVSMQEKMLGIKHPRTLRSRIELALILQSEGKYDAALEMLESLLEIVIEVLGADRAVTLACRSNIAVCHRSLGHYDVAREQLESLIAVQEGVFGSRHLDTLRSRIDLALILQSEGKYDAALKMLESLLEIVIEVLGAEHPITLTCRSNIAACHRSLGHYGVAREQLESLIAVQEGVFGSRHLDTLRSRNSLALTLQSESKYDAALEMLESLLEAELEVLGAEHPATLSRRHDIALCHRDLEEYDVAREQLESLIVVQELVFGVTHSDTLLSREDLAYTLQFDGKNDAALEMLESLLETELEVLGAEHPATLSRRHDIALCHRDLGHYDVAREQLESLIAVQEGVFGSRHLDTLRSRNSLALTLQSESKYDATLEMLESLLETELEVLGAEHPATLSRRHDIASCLRAQRKYGSAIEHLKN